jgi:CBS domain-containing protein
MKVSELMTKDVVTVEPETSLKDVAAVLATKRISGVPVASADGRVLGIVSEADIVVVEQGAARVHGRLLGWVLSGGNAEAMRLNARTAGDAMTTPAITISAGADVSLAARRMTDAGIKRLPVVGKNDELVGIVTRSDLVRAFARSDEELTHEIRGIIRGGLWADHPELVDVQVKNGDVTLGGTVDRRSDEELLRLFVARIPGVVGVRSYVEWVWDDRKARV